MDVCFSLLAPAPCPDAESDKWLRNWMSGCSSSSHLKTVSTDHKSQMLHIDTCRVLMLTCAVQVPSRKDVLL